MEKKKLDEIEFVHCKYSYFDDYNWVHAVHIYINGKKLSSLAKIIEAPFAAAEGYPQLAGIYAPLRASDLLSILEGEWYCYDEDSAVVYSSLVGEIGDWPLSVKIEENEKYVVWKGFKQYFRENWSYEGLGPFVFDRRQYECQLKKLRRMAELKPYKRTSRKFYY